MSVITKIAASSSLTGVLRSNWSLVIVPAIRRLRFLESWSRAARSIILQFRASSIRPMDHLFVSVAEYTRQSLGSVTGLVKVERNQARSGLGQNAKKST